MVRNYLYFSLRQTLYGPHMSIWIRSNLAATCDSLRLNGSFVKLDRGHMTHTLSSLLVAVWISLICLSLATRTCPNLVCQISKLVEVAATLLAFLLVTGAPNDIGLEISSVVDNQSRGLLKICCC